MSTSDGTFLPYGRQSVDDDDIAAVVEVLRSDWLTTGPAVEQFERVFADLVGATYAVAVSSGTAALHLAMLAAGIERGDEVIVPTMTFAASANCARYVGADVVFADSRPDTLGIDVDHVASLVTDRTRAIVAVDYAGIPVDLDELADIARQHDLVLIEDACHAPGAMYRGRPVGSIASLSTFSFHPVKHLTTGEGGMVTTEDANLARRLRRLRNHGIDDDFRQREQRGTWEYDVAELGFNYRLADINCALGASQVRKVPDWLDRRREIVARYRELLDGLPVEMLAEPADRESAWHLFPIRVLGPNPAARRAHVYAEMRSGGIGVNVHYRPVHLHSVYACDGHGNRHLPVAEDAYERLLSLPLWPGLLEADLRRVVDRLANSLRAARA